MAGLKIERMTILFKTKSTTSLREIWKLVVLVAIVTHSSYLHAQNTTIEVWKGGRRSEVQIRNVDGNGFDSSNNKARAQKALIEAQTQMQMGNFSEAIQLARFADSFPVGWGPSEISPRQVLGQLRAYRKRTSTDGKTRRRVKPFLWEAPNFSNIGGTTTQRAIPSQPVSNSSSSDDRFRSNRFAESRFQRAPSDNRFPPFPSERKNGTTTTRSNRTLPRSWENTENKSTDPWPHSETAKASSNNRTTGTESPFIVDNKIEDKKTQGPLLIRSPVKTALESKVETVKTSQEISGKTATEKTGRELFPVPPPPRTTIPGPSVAATSKSNTPAAEEPSSLLLNSTVNLLSTMIGVITGALGVIFLLKLFGKQLGPLVKVEVVGDGAAFFQQHATTDSVPPLRAERSEEELEKHFEIPSLGSSYAEKRKADEENRQKQEQEIFKLIMEQNIELREQLAQGNHAA